MMEMNPLYGHAWIEPHLFWLGITSLAIAYFALRRAERREREWEELRQREEFKKAMDKK